MFYSIEGGEGKFSMENSITLMGFFKLKPSLMDRVMDPWISHSVTFHNLEWTDGQTEVSIRF